MTEESKKDGVFCGVVIWWQKFDETVFIPIEEVNKLFSNPENKSIKYVDLDTIIHYKIKGKKKKIMWKYDLTDFISNIKGELHGI